MANLNCSACEDLRTDAPNFVLNGIGNTEASSLMNNTGFNPSSGNDDCTDLHNANDCLVGNMEAEVDAYEVCDWKTFMKKFIPNVWQTLKAIIYSICGLWDRTDSLCELMSATISPPTQIYGTLPHATETTVEPSSANRCGSIYVKNGTPMLTPISASEINPPSLHRQNVGLWYANQTITACDGTTSIMYEWIAPHFFRYYINENATNGDILWYCDKETAQSVMGISDYLWYRFTESSWYWYTVPLTDSIYKLAVIEVTIDPDRMGENYITIVYHGIIAGGSLTDYSQLGQLSNGEKLYTHEV